MGYQRRDRQTARRRSTCHLAFDIQTSCCTAPNSVRSLNVNHGMVSTSREPSVSP
jgi:hypothetical protein